MRIENSDGSSIEIPNWLVVVLAVIIAGALIPLTALIAPLFGG